MARKLLTLSLLLAACIGIKLSGQQSGLNPAFLGAANVTPAAPAGGVYPLDNVAGEINAYSCAASPRDAYNGSLIRVRRASDDTQQDIGQNADGTLDESSLTTFVGSTNGYITTWYDCVGSLNLTQATTTAQALIVTNGTVQNDSAGVPAAYFDGGDWYEDSATGLSISDYPMSIVSFVDPASTALDTAFVWSGNKSSPSQYFGIGTDSSGFARAFSRAPTFVAATGTNDIATASVRVMVSGVWSSATSRVVWVSTVPQGTNTTSTTYPSADSLAIGRFNDSSPDGYLTGLLTDAWVFSTAIGATEINSMSSDWE